MTSRSRGPRTTDGIARRIGEECATREDQPFAIGVGNEVRPGFDRCRSSGRLLSRDDVTEIVRVSDARQDLDEFFAFEP
jgi:hypothetical protein